MPLTLDSTETCLVPDCDNDRHIRGLCRSHYNYATTLILRGKTSWEEMVRLGKALPAKRKTAPGNTWLIEK